VIGKIFGRRSRENGWRVGRCRQTIRKESRIRLRTDVVEKAKVVDHVRDPTEPDRPIRTGRKKRYLRKVR
jgi:hypothetical protein